MGYKCGRCGGKMEVQPEQPMSMIKAGRLRRADVLHCKKCGREVPMSEVRNT